MANAPKCAASQLTWLAALWDKRSGATMNTSRRCSERQIYRPREVMQARVAIDPFGFGWFGV
jgi:hypothetical protein